MPLRSMQQQDVQVLLESGIVAQPAAGWGQYRHHAPFAPAASVACCDNDDTKCALVARQGTVAPSVAGKQQDQFFHRTVPVWGQILPAKSCPNHCCAPRCGCANSECCWQNVCSKMPCLPMTRTTGRILSWAGFTCSMLQRLPEAVFHLKAAAQQAIRLTRYLPGLPAAIWPMLGMVCSILIRQPSYPSVCYRTLTPAIWKSVMRLRAIWQQQATIRPPQSIWRKWWGVRRCIMC